MEGTEVKTGYLRTGLAVIRNGANVGKQWSITLATNRCEKWGAEKGVAKLAGLDDDSSSYRCTKKIAKLNRQFSVLSFLKLRFLASVTAEMELSAAPAGWRPFSFNSAPPLTESGPDLKFPAGSDPEPWRCRRTDGKKWSFQFPATASCDQNRCNEWFARGGNTCNQQKQQFVLSPPPSTLGYTIGNAINMNASSLYRPELSSNEQGFVNPNPFLEGQEARSHHQVNSAFLSHNMAFLQGSLNANAGIVHPTQHFIDAQFAGQKDGLDNTDHSSLSSLICKSSDRKLPFCSFRLSVPGGVRGSDGENQGLSVGMLNAESQSSSSIMPGGPLGEALCLGAASNLGSPHGYSNSSGTSS
nr:growth-regulating factor 8-like [Ipomoea batatas]